MNNNISDKDKKSWENFISSKEKLPNKDINSDRKKNRKSIRIDLHGYNLIDANNLVKKSIVEGFKNGIFKITVVTGKGIHSNVEKNPYVSKDLSILKYSVPEFLKNDMELMKKIREIEIADIKDGGSGAFYIFLKKNNL
ncbi:Smr/MutS family protein [Candidatus Pelagibacter sp.]|nr:Smr/MutS family protein [Candidatus Pelagibacter sp.]